MNSYYNNDTNTILDGTSAQASDVENKCFDIAAAFDLLEVDVGNSLLLTAVDYASREISATAAVRANRAIGFDSSGELALLQGYDYLYGGDWVTATVYEANTIVLDSNDDAGFGTDAVLICTTAHTSTNLVSDAANWGVLLSTAALDAAVAAAQASASAAAASEAAALVSETGAADDALNAGSWADEDEDVPVKEYTGGVPSDRVPTAFSAKHHAAKANTFNPDTYVEIAGDIMTGDLETPDLVLSELDKQLNAGSVVGVYLYDVTQDDDGGAWTDQTQHTSWYNEALNTANRGATRKFPKRVVIDVSTTTLTIYDVTDQSTPMWMTSVRGGAYSSWTDNTFNMIHGFQTISGVVAKNGKIYIVGQYLTVIDLIEDKAYILAATITKEYGSNISNRDGGAGYEQSIDDDFDFIVNNDTNKVAVISNGDMTNTVAIATDAGISTLHPDGSVYDITGQSSAITELTFTKNRLLNCPQQWDAYLAFYPIPTQNVDRLTELQVFYQTSQPTLEPTNPKVLTTSGRRIRIDNFASAGSEGITLMDWQEDAKEVMVHYITASYASGWIKGDIRRALLANSKTVDRSVKAATLTENGTITEAPAMTNSEISAYSGFSATDYLSQPYSAELDFGTDDCYIMGWLKMTDGSGVNSILQRRKADGTGNLIYASVNGNVLQTTFGSLGSTTIPDNVWTFFVTGRKSGVGYIFINSVLDVAIPNASNLTQVDALLTVGVSYNFGNIFKGSLSLLRIGAGFPSSKQIEKIYNTEKFLFQDDADCTIVGSINSIQSITYDEVTDELHASSGGGISTFKDLVRVREDETRLYRTSLAAHDSILVDGV